uniref:Uncharacterized protein n=1 Tax=Sphaerodactylus townsendi TaxID=933632 RepID=A0ACB8F1Z4_9SAUR
MGFQNSCIQGWFILSARFDTGREKLLSSGLRESVSFSNLWRGGDPRLEVIRLLSGKPGGGGGAEIIRNKMVLRNNTEGRKRKGTTLEAVRFKMANEDLSHSLIGGSLDVKQATGERWSRKAG